MKKSNSKVIINVERGIDEKAKKFFNLTLKSEKEELKFSKLSLTCYDVRDIVSHLTGKDVEISCNKDYFFYNQADLPINWQGFQLGFDSYKEGIETCIIWARDMLKKIKEVQFKENWTKEVEI